MNQSIAIGVDLAKRVFQVCVMQKTTNHVLANKAVKRKDFLRFIQSFEPCAVYMEACGGSHHWQRELSGRGYQSHLIAPQFVAPFRKGHKTDVNDALAIVEAGLRPKMRFVAHKNIEQQNIQSLHRIRARITEQRTALVNQTHGLLLEYGIVSGTGIKALKQAVEQYIAQQEQVGPTLFTELLNQQMNELSEIEQRLKALDKQLHHWIKQNETCQQLMSLRGVGPVAATQLYAALGTGREFKQGRQASASLGLTPKQHSSGGKVRLGKTGHTGQPQLKATLIRGAHAVIKNLGNKDDALSRWLRALIARAGVNKAAVAYANKLARMAWAMLRYETVYKPVLATAH